MFTRVELPFQADSTPLGAAHLIEGVPGQRALQSTINKRPVMPCCKPAMHIHRKTSLVHFAARVVGPLAAGCVSSTLTSCWSRSTLVTGPRTPCRALMRARSAASSRCASCSSGPLPFAAAAAA